VEAFSDLGFSISTEARNAGSVSQGNLNQGMTGMKRARSIVVGFAAFAMTAGTAAAADVPAVVVAPPAPPPPIAASFDWAGMYVGTQIGIASYTPEFEASALGGYNFVFGRFLVGFEVRGGIFVPGPGPAYAWQWGAQVRAGVFLGDRALAYVKIGGHYVFGWFTTGALGVELAVGQSVSLFAEVQTFLPLGGPSMRVRGGVTWHPGN